MTDDGFDKMVNEIQKKINHEEEVTYSKKVIKEYRNPSNFGSIKNPDASGKIKGPCGDTMSVDLGINNGIISKVRFWTDGCGASIACGSLLTKKIKGKTLQDANNITSKDLLESLDGLPIENHHCTVLAVNTLNECIKNYNKQKKKKK